MKEQIYQVSKFTSASIYASIITETLLKCSQDQRMNRHSPIPLLLTQAKDRNYCQRSKTCYHCHTKEISSEVPSSH